MPGELRRDRRLAARAALARRHRPPRAAPRPRNASRGRAVDAASMLVVEHARDALDDREAKPEAARHLGTLIEAVELLENRALLRAAGCRARCRRRRCAAVAAAGAAADQHAALGRVFDGVGDEVLQQPPQQPPIGLHREPSRARIRAEPLLAAPAARTRPRAGASSSSMRKANDFRLHGSGVEPRNVEQRAEYLLDGVERGIDIADQAAHPAGRPAARPGW